MSLLVLIRQAEAESTSDEEEKGGNRADTDTRQLTLSESLGCSDYSDLRGGCAGCREA
jgi:hypothetical protein